MSSWTSGYVTDIEYTSGFYRELAPSYLQFVLLSQKLRSSPIGPGTTYCELGCGQGFGTALLAAANPQAQFWGFDFNPAQIASARRLAEDAGLANITFEDYSFEQAVALPFDALPQFDTIVLHGIYSWISPENRRFIVEFIQKRLKPGGLVYVSYNCLPGWAGIAPIQRLMREKANRDPDRSDLQAEAALKFAERLRSGGAAYFAQNPSSGPRMDKLPSMNSQYLAHEYLNGHWYPFYHLDVVREMEPARLVYAASASLAENIDTVSVPADILALLTETRDSGWKETIRDFASNKQFRRDLFMRGAPPLAALEQGRLLSELRFGLMVPRAVVSFKFRGPIGDFTGQEDIYLPIVDALAQRPHTLTELKQLPGLSERSPAALLQAAIFLVHSGQVHPLPNDPHGNSGDIARAFNRVVAGRIRIGQQLSFLAAPAAGTGLGVSYVELIAVLALLENPTVTPQQAAQLGWSIMAQTGQRLMKEGKTLQGQAETMPELEKQLAAIWNEKLPVWRMLGVV